ncbi:Ig-like domain-containing protein [Alloscardovia theropitheci]|nr:Ig-like domain-containing protein [Alloscardovia theropitheci]
MKRQTIIRMVCAVVLSVLCASGVAAVMSQNHSHNQNAYAAETTTTVDPSAGKSTAGNDSAALFTGASIKPSDDWIFSQDNHADAYYVGQKTTLSLNRARGVANTINDIYYYVDSTAPTYTLAKKQGRNFSFDITSGAVDTRDIRLIVLYSDGRFDNLSLHDVPNSGDLPAHIITGTDGAQLIVTYDNGSEQIVNLNQKGNLPILGHVTKVRFTIPNLIQRVEAAKDYINAHNINALPLFLNKARQSRGEITRETTVNTANNSIDVPQLVDEFNSSEDSITLRPTPGFSPIRGALTAVNGNDDEDMSVDTYVKAGKLDVTNVSFDGIGSDHSTKVWDGTTTHFFTTIRQIKLKISAQSTEPADAQGVKPKLPEGTSIQVNFPAVYFPNERPERVPSQSVVIGKDGTATIDFPREGVYKVKDITLTYRDANGNKQTRPIMDFIDATDNFKKDNLEEIVWMKSLEIDENPQIQIVNNNGSENTNEYHKNDVKFRIIIKDRWLEYFKYLNESEVSEALKITRDGKPVDNKNLTFANSEWKQTSPGVYTSNIFSLGEYTKSKDNKPAEGRYDISVNYKKHTGTRNNIVIDYTAPQAGKVTVATDNPQATKPQEKTNKSTKDKWLVSSSHLRLTISDIKDATSGVDKDKLALVRADGSEYPGYTLTKSDDGSSVSFDIDDNNGVVKLDEIYLRLEDKAGNEDHSHSLAELAQGKSDVYGFKGVLVDTTAPEMSVSYDNNDVRNEKYYKAHRHGTVTINESNFSLMRDLSDDDDVVVARKDGNVSSTVKLSDFKQNDGNGPWIAQFDASSDGNWIVDAQYKDAAGNAAQSAHDEFVVDTIAPVLSVTFDNNNVINGKYFNASRVATISQVERNFSTEDTKVNTTWAMNAQSGVTAGPAAGSWNQSGDSATYSTSVSFTSDGRYTMTVTATDLAGNAASNTIEVGEFIIDTTKPTIDFANIQDKTAYNGKVAPQILFNDTNFNASKTSFTLKAVRHENVSKVTSFADSITAQSRQVSFADFAREVDSDDVYTLTARMTDEAENVTEKSITFSVNRFGSTYALSQDTAKIRGKFVKKTGNVVIDEINVSGLETDKTKVVIAHDSASRILNTSEYSGVATDDKGWSRTRYTIPAQNFEDDGYYRVIVSSVDKAGNVSENTMDKKDESRTHAVNINFAVDNTKPSASVIGAQSHAVFYSADGRTLTVQAQDNLKLSKVALRVDGKTVGQWTGDELVASPATYKLDSDAKDHDIQLTAYDEAGNRTIVSYDDMAVATSWWQYMREHAVMTLIIMFVGAAALILLMLIALALVIRHRRTQYRRNPFNH